MVIQALKSLLVRLGPTHWTVRRVLALRARQRGFCLRFAKDKILVQDRSREMVLSLEQFVQVPTMLAAYDEFFDVFVAETVGERARLDFSEPRLQRYAKSGVAFYFPSIPEEGQLDAYTHHYVPKSGDVVWDAGAHAGATTYFLSKLVGEEGTVYAFEPDERNYVYLLRNIELHGLRNVIPVKKALAATSGTARFNMDGTMCAGLSEYLIYREDRFDVTVETLSLPDACASLGHVPAYVKMDIEGAEVAVIQGAQEFLTQHSIRFAIESFHQLDGEYTFRPLEALFGSIGYSVESSDHFGQMFTWAEPRDGAARG